MSQTTPGDTPPEQVHSKSIIVIHPGSLNLRIGRASDLNPLTVLHAIARRRLPYGQSYRDTFLPERIDLSQPQEFEEARLAVSHTLQSCLQSDGRRRYATPPQQIAAFNRRSQPELLGNNGGEWIKPEGDVVVGNDILRLNPEEDFNVHFPYKRGDLNVHPGGGGSITAIMADLEAIWGQVLETNFQISKDDLKQCKAVLIIPDVYNRMYLRELMYLLLSKMGFGSCFLVQDHQNVSQINYENCITIIIDFHQVGHCIHSVNPTLAVSIFLRHSVTFILGMTGLKESLDTTSSDLLNDSFLDNQPNNANEDDIVVDAMDPVVMTSVREFVTNPGQILGLDQAVLQSIDRCPNEEIKRKMYGCILVVGGGMKFSGIATWLQNRISLQIPYLYRAEQLDIVTNPRDMDSSMVAWKGACILSCLETAHELWIQAGEWEKFGVRILRERAPFTW
nr:actin-related protein 8 [Leptinotarsa decemlineata]